MEVDKQLGIEVCYTRCVVYSFYGPINYLHHTYSLQLGSAFIARKSIRWLTISLIIINTRKKGNMEAKLADPKVLCPSDTFRGVFIDCAQTLNFQPSKLPTNGFYN